MFMGFTYKAWEDLTIQDDFMFKAVMREKKICIPFTEECIQKKIADIHYLEDEKTMKASYEGKGIRLDVYIEDIEQKIYNLEMQVGQLMIDDLAKRSRYYQSQIDIDTLSRGADYVELNDNYIVFICPYDPVGLGWYKYEYENRSTRDPNIPMGDGTKKIIINTKSKEKDIPPRLKSLMDYINGVVSADPLVQSIETQIKNVKRNEKERVSYMTYLAHLRDERKAGISEGINRGVTMANNNNAKAMLSDGVPVSRIAKYTNLSLDAIHTLARENNLPFVDK